MKSDYLRTDDLKLTHSSSDSWFSDSQPNELHRLGNNGFVEVFQSLVTHSNKVSWNRLNVRGRLLKINIGTSSLLLIWTSIYDDKQYTLLFLF